MAKTYKILVNDGKGTDIKPVSVMQGASANGEPVRMNAKRGWRFELQDDLKGKNLGPDQVRLKRMGKNLGLMFDGSVNPDVIIEDFYAENEDKEKDNGSPMIVGQAEDGGMYEYVPQDPAASSMASQLKDGNTPVIVALGGGPLAADFALAGLPLIAAAGGGIGGLLAGGAAVVAAAAAGGGGGGGDAPTVVVAPTGQTGRLLEGATNDTGLSSTDSITMNQNPVYRGVAEKGAAVEVTVNGVTYKTTASATDGTFSVQLTNNGQVLADGIYTPTIKATNSAGSTTVNGTSFTVDHKTDKNQDETKSPTEVDDNNNSTATVAITTIDDGLDTTTSVTGSKDTGRLADDFITNDGTLNFSGTVTNFVSNGDVVHVQVFKADGTTLIVDQYVTPDSTGKWTIDNKANALIDGKYTIKAQIEDKAGNVVQTANDQVLIIDSSTNKNQPNNSDDANATATIAIGGIDDGPLTTTAANGSKDTGSSASDLITSDGTLTFSGTVGGFNSNGDLVHLRVFKADGVTLLVNQYLTPDNLGKWAFDNQGVNLLDGKYIIKASIEDKAGNIVKSAADKELIVDSNPNKNQPNNSDDANATATIAIGGIDDGLTTTAANGSKDTGSSASDLITSDGSLTFSGTVGSFNSNGDLVHLRVFKADGVTLVVDQYLTPNSQGQWSFSNQSTTLSDGKYIIKASIEDKAGNIVKAAADKDLIVDTNPGKNQPNDSDDVNANATIVIGGIDDGLTTTTASTGSKDTGSSASDLITSDGSLTFSGTVGGFNSNGDLVHLRVFKADGVTLMVNQYLTPDNLGKWAFNNQGTSLLDGKYIIKASIEDKAGNIVKSAADKELIVDSTKEKKQPNDENDENNDSAVTIAIVGIDDGDSATNTTTGSKDTGTSSTDMLTSDTTLVFNGTIGSFVQNGDLVHFKVTKVVNGVPTVVIDQYVTPSNNGNWSFDNHLVSLDAGTYSVNATLEDKAGNIIKTAASKTLVIESAAPATTANLAISSITEDLGSNQMDFITSDNKLTVRGTTDLPANSNANIFVQIKSGSTIVKSGYATLTNPSSSNAGWTFVIDSDSGSSFLADGSYTISAVFTTQAGTEISTPQTHSLRVANGQAVLIANPDVGSVTEGSDPTAANVLTNDSDSTAGIQVDKVEKGSSITNTTSTKTVSGSTGTVLKGDFGTLELFADGHYVYTPDGSLKGGVTRQDVFTYEVQAVGSNRTAATTLRIDVTGVEDAANITVTGGSVRPITNGSVGDSGSVIKVVDDDAGDAVLKGLRTDAGANPALVGENGSLVLTTTSTTGEYSWNYTKKAIPEGSNLTTLHKSDVVQHDLFTFESKDGSFETTLDFKLKQTSDVVRKHEAFGQTTTVDTLEFKDSNQQLTLDFTSPSVATSDTLLTGRSVEVIDITGLASNGSTTPSNTIKLNLSSLLQTDTFDGTNHRLYIKGDQGDTVEFNSGATPIGHDATARVVDGTSYWVYHLGADELLVQTVMTATVNG